MWLPMLFGVTLALLSACARQAVQLPPPSAVASGSQDYLIGPEDVIEVLVWKNPDLSRQVSVRPDGKISLPLIGDVQAAGRTSSQITAGIIEKLRSYYKDPPPVSVIVDEVNSYAIYFLGEVAKPGKYAVQTGTTFLHAVALAGGFTEFAATRRIVIRRRLNGQNETVIGVRYKDVMTGRQANIMLKPGDIIVVP